MPKFSTVELGFVKVLFETPSGFAIFSFDGQFLKKNIKHIWSYFVGDYWHERIIWLDEFKKFEDKATAINLTTEKIDTSLIMMLWNWCQREDKLLVGRPEYKRIIEGSLGLTCLYDAAVMEVMWGLQNLMHTLLPEEKSVISKEDRIPICRGMAIILNRYHIDVKPEMVNERIVKLVRRVHDIELRERAHAKFLHRLDKDFEELSGVDSKRWCLIKLATALKLMCDPGRIICLFDPIKMFAPNEYRIIEEDAAKYQDKMTKHSILRTYNDVISLHDAKIQILLELKYLVEEATKAEAEWKPAINGVDSKLQVDCTYLRGDQPTVHNQSSVDEEQHYGIAGENSPSSLFSKVDGKKSAQGTSAESLPELPLRENAVGRKQGTVGSEVKIPKEDIVASGARSSISSVAPQAIPTESSTLPISVEQSSVILDDVKAGDHKTEDIATQMNTVQHDGKVDGKKNAQETSGEWLPQLQLRDNAEGRKQTEGVVGSEVNKQKQDIAASGALSSISSVAPQAFATKSSTLPISVEQLSVCLDDDKVGDHKETEDSAGKSIAQSRLSYNANGRKQTEGLVCQEVKKLKEEISASGSQLSSGSRPVSLRVLLDEEVLVEDIREILDATRQQKEKKTSAQELANDASLVKSGTSKAVCDDEPPVKSGFHGTVAQDASAVKSGFHGAVAQDATSSLGSSLSDQYKLPPKDIDKKFSKRKLRWMLFRRLRCGHLSCL